MIIHSKHSERTKRLMSASHLLSWKNNPQQGYTGNQHTTETRNKMKKAQLLRRKLERETPEGRCRAEEMRKNMSIAQTARRKREYKRR